MKPLAILATLFLASCSGVQLGEGRPTANPAFGVGGFADSVYTADMKAWQAEQPAIRKNDPNETPRIVRINLPNGKHIMVSVYDERCADVNGEAIRFGNTVYLCGRKKMERHELAHVAGMSHTDWVYTGVARCSIVTAAGYTSYRVGQQICIANDYEWAAN